MQYFGLRANANSEMFQPSRGVLLIFLTILGLWTTSQSLLILYTVQDWLGGPKNEWKSFLGAFLTIWALAILLIETSRRKYLMYDRSLLILPILFLIYNTLSSFLSGRINFPLMIFHWLWILAVYIVFPNFLRNEREQRMALCVVFWANLLPALSGIFWGITSGQMYWYNRQHRLIFDFSNPNLYANSWQVSFIIALYFLIGMKGILKKILTFCFIICSIILIYLATSRNAILFSFSTILIYISFFNRRNVNRKILLFSCMIISAIVMFYLTNPELDMDMLNVWSSGRLANWAGHLNHYSRNSSMIDYIFTFTGLTGVQELPLTSIADSNRTDSSFVRLHFDNSYIALLLNHGLIGMILFLFPLFIMFWRTYILTVFANSEHRNKYALALGCWVGIFVQMIPSAYIPSFGNVINILVLVLLLPLVYGTVQSD